MNTVIIVSVMLAAMVLTMAVQNVMADVCNTTTTGPFTDFFNKIGGCPVKVLFESPNSVQLQYDDMAGLGAGFITQLETAWHWYVISHQDDGNTTTIVLAPLR